MTDETTVDVGAMHEEFDMLRAQIIALQEQLTEKDKQIAELGWADSELHRKGGAFCRGCFKRGLWIAALIGGYAVLGFLALTSCATPAQGATPNMDALWAATPDARLQFPAHHLGAHHCEGELIFSSKTIEFHCFKNAKKNFTVEREAVDKADDNGIKLRSGAKYHFNIAGFTKDGTRSLFGRWVETTSMVQARQLRDEKKPIVETPQKVSEDGGLATPTEAKAVPVVLAAPVVAAPIATATPDPPQTPQPAKALVPTTPPASVAYTVPVTPTPHIDPSPAEPRLWDQWRNKLAASPPRFGVALGVFSLFPLAFAGIWSFRFVKDRQPWRKWKLYQALMAARDTFRGEQ